MLFRRCLFATAVFCCLSLLGANTYAQANAGAAAVFTKGKQMLAGGDFDGALKAFAQAARADTANREYRGEYSVLRRVIRMRESLANEKNEKKWEADALALRSYYCANKLHKEALPLDREAFNRANTAANAARLGSTLLALKQNDEAAKFLGSLDESAQSVDTALLHGIALARLGNMDEAKQVAGKITLPPNANGDTLFALARLHSLIGSPNDACKNLQASFERTLPSQLESARAEAKDCPDFTTIASTEGFETALKTESKLKESDCSTGSSCGTCSRAGSCSSSKSTGSTEKPEAK